MGNVFVAELGVQIGDKATNGGSFNETKGLRKVADEPGRDGS